MKWIVLGSMLWLLSCSPREIAPTLFTLMPGDSTGITFSNDLQHTEEFNMYTYRNFYNGGGVGVGDINNDNLPDLFFCGNMVDNKLYLNKGDFKFEDITEMAGVASKNIWSTGVSLADVNGDGWLDIYVCKSGKPGGEQRHNELFINNGDLTFREEAKQYGIADEGLSSHAAFFDYDRDGDLDCYLLNNSFRPVGGYDMRPGLREVRDSLGGNKLYRNNLIPGSHDTSSVFTDVSEEAGIYGSSIGFGLGVTIGDIDRDGWQDIFVSNDFFERDYLYINQKDGTFLEDLTSRMSEISMGSMGADMADINNDGFPEVFVTEMLPRSEARYKTKMTFDDWDKYQLTKRSGYHQQFTRNVLQLNAHGRDFREIGRMANVHATDWSWSALIADFDNDGWKDIYVSNGIFKDLLDQDYIRYYSNDPEIVEAIKNREPDAIRRLIEKIPSEPISNFAFRNDGDLTFSDFTREWGLQTPSFSNGSAYADLDNDGDLDIVVNNCNMPAFVFRNNSHQTVDHHYLQLKLKGELLNVYALGSQVTLHAGDKTMYQELSPMRGFQSCIDPVITFGLGETETIDLLQVRWPDGKITEIENIKGNQRLELDQHDAGVMLVKDTLIPEENQLLEKVVNPLPYQHEENHFVDFDRDRLLFHMVSTEGPHITKGDMNGDGLEDLYLSGASGHPGRFLLQNQNGFFITNEVLALKEKFFEDTDGTLFDADGDEDLDLFVTSGGNEFGHRSPFMEDRLYLNDGNGLFSRTVERFDSVIHQSSSCVEPSDFDQDGDIDLFVGTRLVPGVYGVPVSGHLWENDGNGYFSLVTASRAPDLSGIGLIKDACWLDFDQDDDQDLVVVGEWMPVTLLRNDHGHFTDVTKQSGFAGSNGFWNCIETGDIDGDGLIDMVLGNHGENSRLKASSDQPLTLYINDFDDNQTPEQILTMFNGDQAYPLPLRHDLVMQMPGLKKDYLLYKDYKEKQIDDIITREAQRTAAKVEIYTTSSAIAWNLGNGSFQLENLPQEAQFAPIYGILVQDLNHDYLPEVILGGNFYEAKPEIGIYDASRGLVLRMTEGGQLQVMKPEKSGLYIKGAIRDFESIVHNNQELLLVARNNDSLAVLRIRENSASKLVN